MATNRAKTRPKPIGTEGVQDVANELLREFENLPAEIRQTVASHVSTTKSLEYVASGIRALIDDQPGTVSSDALRRTAALVLSHVAQASTAVAKLQLLAGRLEGFAWAVDALEGARHFAKSP